MQVSQPGRAPGQACVRKDERRVDDGARVQAQRPEIVVQGVSDQNGGQEVGGVGDAGGGGGGEGRGVRVGQRGRDRARGARPAEGRPVKGAGAQARDARPPVRDETFRADQGRQEDVHRAVA
jgi:hypothetical protein